MVQHASLMALKKHKNWMHKFDFIFTFLLSTHGQIYKYSLKFIHTAPHYTLLNICKLKIEQTLMVAITKHVA